MWPDSDFDAAGGSARPEDRLLANSGQQEYPNQEVIDYYLAKASGMRARQFRRILSRSWKAMHRFVRRQLSPCTRVKLPPTAA